MLYKKLGIDKAIYSEAMTCINQIVQIDGLVQEICYFIANAL